MSLGFRDGTISATPPSAGFRRPIAAIVAVGLLAASSNLNALATPQRQKTSIQLRGKANLGIDDPVKVYAALVAPPKSEFETTAAYMERTLRSPKTYTFQVEKHPGINTGIGLEVSYDADKQNLSVWLPIGVQHDSDGVEILRLKETRHLSKHVEANAFGRAVVVTTFRYESYAIVPMNALRFRRWTIEEGVKGVLADRYRVEFSSIPASRARLLKNRLVVLVRVETDAIPTDKGDHYSKATIEWPNELLVNWHFLRAQVLAISVVDPVTGEVLSHDENEASTQH